MNKYELISFFDWINDGNVIRTVEGKFSTQDAQYRNRLSYIELKQYFKKEFMS